MFEEQLYVLVLVRHTQGRVIIHCFFHPDVKARKVDHALFPAEMTCEVCCRLIDTQV